MKVSVDDVKEYMGEEESGETAFVIGANDTVSVTLSLCDILRTPMIEPTL